MDLKPILKALLPLMEPMLEGVVSQFWVQIDAEIDKIAQEDVKFVLKQLSPGMKAAVVGELRKLMA